MTEWAVAERRTGAGYWDVARQALRVWNPALADDSVHVSRLHRRIVQLNLHAQQNLDPSTLSGRSVRMPDLSALLAHAHAGPPQSLSPDEVAHRLRAGAPGAPVDLQGATVAGPLRLQSLVVAGHVCLSGANVQGDVSLLDCEIAGFLCLDNATIDGQLQVREGVLGDDLSLDRAVVKGAVVLQNLSGPGSLSFDRLQVQDSVHVKVDVEGAVYLGGLSGAPNGVYLSQTRAAAGVYADELRLDGHASLNSVRTDRAIALSRAVVQGPLHLEACHAREVVVRGAEVEGDVAIPNVEASVVDLRDNVFQRGFRFSSGVPTSATLDRSRVLGGPVSVELGAATLTANEVEFAQGGTVELATGDVRLDAARLPAATVLRGSDMARQPRLLSVRRTRLTGLVLVNVDASGTEFAGASDVDKLRLESDISWAHAPRGARRPWTSRSVLREEVLVRSRAGQGAWADLLEGDSSATGGPTAGQVAELYRGLRKGMEDRRNEPEAADFYYGEMEMRRMASRNPSEKALLTLYWLVSGYGLRAWRALAALLILLTASTVVMALWGFQDMPAHDCPSFLRNLLPAATYSAESAVVVFRGADQLVPTLAGRWCQITLRVLGPVFLALAVLSVRGRVKR